MENQPPAANHPDTSKFLDWVEIKNFKSIKDLRLDCKRVNIFIGKPNVGKSNILEALGMLGAEYFTDGFMKGGVRYENVRHLFYQNDPGNELEINSDKECAALGVNAQNNLEYVFVIDSDNSIKKFEYEKKISLAATDIKISENKTFYFNEKGVISRVIDTDQRLAYKKYDFKNINNFKDKFANNLLPNGQNLFQIINRSEDLKNEFGRIFQEQGLDLVLDVENQAFTVQRKDGFYIYKYQFYTIADTLRRFMFYITAIESNSNSVLIFEEPEVHSFPEYVDQIAQRIIMYDENQYFVSTHSPYLLNRLIAKTPYADLNVFVTYYENYETKVRALSAEELRDVLDFGTNIFFNIDRFTPNAGRPVSA